MFIIFITSRTVNVCQFLQFYFDSSCTVFGRFKFVNYLRFWTVIFVLQSIYKTPVIFIADDFQYYHCIVLIFIFFSLSYRYCRALLERTVLNVSLDRYWVVRSAFEKVKFSSYSPRLVASHAVIYTFFFFLLFFPPRADAFFATVARVTDLPPPTYLTYR